jgi:predicted P-loop ATPase
MGYLKDETEGRRFLPVKVGRIDIDKLSRDRDQLWADAVARYWAGEPWWLTNKSVLAEAEQHQRDRYIGDPWESVISSYTGSRNEVGVSEILQDALYLEKGRWGQTEQNRIARGLAPLGWSRVQVRTGNKREWRYRRPVTSGDTTAFEGEQTSNVTTLKLVTGADR